MPGTTRASVGRALLPVALLLAAPAPAWGTPPDDSEPTPAEPPAAGAPAVDRPWTQRSLVLTLDGQRDRRSGGDPFGDASFSVRGGTSLAGRVRLDASGFSAWGVFAQAGARGFLTDLPEVEGGARFLHLDLALAALYAPSAGDAFWFQAGAFVGEQTSLLGSAQVHPVAVALGAHRADDRLQLLYGIGYSFAFGRGLPLPFLGLVWRSAPAWQWEVLLPVHARVRWKASDDLSLTFGLAARGEQFRYQALDPSGAEGVRDLRIARVRLGVGARRALSASTSVRLETGVEGASVDTGLSRRNAAGAYVQVSLGFRGPEPGAGIGPGAPLQAAFGEAP